MSNCHYDAFGTFSCGVNKEEFANTQTATKPAQQPAKPAQQPAKPAQQPAKPLLHCANKDCRCKRNNECPSNRCNLETHKCIKKNRKHHSPPPSPPKSKCQSSTNRPPGCECSNNNECQNKHKCTKGKCV